MKFIDTSGLRWQTETAPTYQNVMCTPMVRAQRLAEVRDDQIWAWVPIAAIAHVPTEAPTETPAEAGSTAP